MALDTFQERLSLRSRIPIATGVDFTREDRVQILGLYAGSQPETKIALSGSADSELFAALSITGGKTESLSGS